MVAAVGREVRWPEVAAGELVTGAPIGVAPAGSSEGRDQLPVCDDPPQITMGFAWSRKCCVSLARLWGAVGGNQARFADHGLGSGLGAGDAEAGSFKIRPGLLRTILANRANV